MSSPVTRAQIAAWREQRNEAMRLLSDADAAVRNAESVAAAVRRDIRTIPDIDIECCVERVWKTDWQQGQCARANGHGPEGLYCKQHAKKHEEAVGE